LDIGKSLADRSLAQFDLLQIRVLADLCPARRSPDGLHSLAQLDLLQIRVLADQLAGCSSPRLRQ
jgi:hypothetical protein